MLPAVPGPDRLLAGACAECVPTSDDSVWGDTLRADRVTIESTNPVDRCT
jgi:hypothetical protein